MLIEFRVENHRSLRDEQVLTMEAGRLGHDTNPRSRSIAGHPEGLLPVAVLYGANASGKSNVLAALAFMQTAVFESHRLWMPDEGIPRDPFAWGPKKLEPSIFEVTVLLDSIRYQYGFVASNERFLEEWLYAWPRGKKQTWFERDDTAFKFGENLRGENKLIEEVTRPNALFLSAAVQHKHVQLNPLYSWFRTLQPYNVTGGRSPFVYVTPKELKQAGHMDDWLQSSSFATDVSPETLAARFRALLRHADIGIEDMKMRSDESNGTGSHGEKLPSFQLKHRSPFDDAWLPLEAESMGTQTFFWMALPLLRALELGSTFVVDELDASLHPSLVQEVIRLFNDPAKNPRHAQLIFTTHDTNLLGTTLGEPVLRRDQVWLTEKDKEGATVLYPLTNYKPRKAENLERGYLQGRYGAIPFLGSFTSTIE
jgi:uncharacterized protein